MKLIVLAAGQGSRLRPLTDDRPKCMVEYRGKELIDYILECARRVGLDDIVIIKGYREDVLVKDGVRYSINKQYDSTNMVSTLFCAEEELNDDIIISYSDIIYQDYILERLIEDKSDFSVVVDENWRELWEGRMEDPLLDAEIMKLDSDGNITELGKKPKSFDEIQGQYIGLIKISKNVVAQIREFYHCLDKTITYDGKDFNNMYMTSFIQMIIDQLMPAKAVKIQGGWLEVDAPSDLEYDLEI